MKGLILAAGKGTRLAELKLAHKSFAMINAKRVIDYSLELLANNGTEPLVNEIIIVVGYHAEEIINYVGNVYNGIPIKYVYQQEQKGIAHAVMTAAEVINDDFVMCLADEILINPKLRDMIKLFYEFHADVVCGAVVDATDFSMKPIAYQVDERQNVRAVTEKPSAYENAYRGIGECVFKKEVLKYLETLSPNPRKGEYEMGDWIRMAIEDNKTVKIFELADAYANINYAADIENASKIVGKG